MADQKITVLVEHTVLIATDVLPIVDITAGSTKKVQVSAFGLTGNPLSQFAATTSAQLAGVMSDETGSGLLVFGTSPTFATQITTPQIIGGTAVGSNITYKSTTGIGTTAGIAHQWTGGNNGATVIATMLNNGNVGIGTTSPGQKLTVQGNGARLRLQTESGPATYYFDIESNYAAGDTINFYGTAGINLLKYVYNDLRLSLMPNGSDGLHIKNTGNVGIGTTNPTNLFSLGGNVARIAWMERHTTANTAGNTLTITAGGATSAATDKAGGNLILQGGLSTGSAESGVIIQGVVAGASGTTDRTQTTAFQVLGNKIGFYAATPTALQTGVAVSAAEIHAALVLLGLITA